MPARSPPAAGFRHRAHRALPPPKGWTPPAVHGGRTGSEDREVALAAVLDELLIAGHQPGPHPSRRRHDDPVRGVARSEEHTSELQSLRHLVCRLLLEKK